MKKILFALCIITGLAACKSESASPAASIDGMFAAMKSGNIDSIKKFVTKSDAGMMEAAEKILEAVNPEALKKIKEKVIADFMENAKNIQYKLKNEKIDGDNATVEAEITDEGKKTTHTFGLVKEDGIWKIALTKAGNEIFNSMKGNMGPGRPDLKTGFDKLQNMDKDTLKMLLNKGAQALDSFNFKAKKKE
ncbi:MAG: DUF4878 domain-containing protein [Ferruginibacter sp.]